MQSSGDEIMKIFWCSFGLKNWGCRFNGAANLWITYNCSVSKFSSKILSILANINVFFTTPEVCLKWKFIDTCLNSGRSLRRTRLYCTKVSLSPFPFLYRFRMNSWLVFCSFIIKILPLITAMYSSF